jgi:hypothetical protein
VEKEGDQPMKPKMKMSKEVRAVFSKMGKRGGAARAASLTPAKRRAIARKAIATRWAKPRPKAKAKTPAKAQVRPQIEKVEKAS